MPVWNPACCDFSEARFTRPDILDTTLAEQTSGCIMSNVSHIGMIYISVDGVFILSIVVAVSIFVTLFFIFTLVDDFYLPEIV